jgi:hypothetical protein
VAANFILTITGRVRGVHIAASDGVAITASTIEIEIGESYWIHTNVIVLNL